MTITNQISQISSVIFSTGLLFYNNKMDTDRLLKKIRKIIGDTLIQEPGTRDAADRIHSFILMNRLHGTTEEINTLELFIFGEYEHDIDRHKKHLYRVLSLSKEG